MLFYEPSSNVTVLDVVECFLRVALNFFSTLLDTIEKNSLGSRSFTLDSKNKLVVKVISNVVAKPITM